MEQFLIYSEHSKGPLSSVDGILEIDNGLISGYLSTRLHTVVEEFSYPSSVKFPVTGFSIINISDQPIKQLLFMSHLQDFPLDFYIAEFPYMEITENVYIKRINLRRDYRKQKPLKILREYEDFIRFRDRYSSYFYNIFSNHRITYESVSFHRINILKERY